MCFQWKYLRVLWWFLPIYNHLWKIIKDKDEYRLWGFIQIFLGAKLLVKFIYDYLTLNFSLPVWCSAFTAFKTSNNGKQLLTEYSISWNDNKNNISLMPSKLHVDVQNVRVCLLDNYFYPVYLLLYCLLY